MSEPKWTPGPWIEEEDGLEVRAASNYKMVAATLGSEERLANANLIAAAPELYEALEIICRFSLPKGGDQIVAFAQAFKALAKARGEEPSR